MTLLSLQRQFHAGLLAAGPRPMSAHNARFERGFEIYRNAYRVRLVACLRESYDRVWSWIGDDAFDRAAIHHLILHPPDSWTLDDAGAGFDATLAELFPGEPEVAELAWLEWQMQLAFRAIDQTPVDPAQFSALTAQFGDADWQNVRFDMVASAALHPLKTSCAEIWAALERAEPFASSLMLETAQAVLVWRHELQPRFRMLADDEARALELVRADAPFEAICGLFDPGVDRQQAASRAGALLGRWIVDGLIAHVV